MNSCIKCKNYIHLLNKCSEGNKISLTYPKVCFEKPKLEYKKQSAYKWTLEKAKEDYLRNKKDCKMCKFSRSNTVILNNSVKTNLHCLVKEKNFINNEKAETCKYYTIESNKI